jgi:imidazole glycerol phosphate synthase glutamine amidotransferase subunit
VSDIGIIDYGMGNLGSVTNACRFLELPFRVIAKPDELEACGAVILPGVGAFGDCMRHLEEHGFVAPIRDWIAADRPFLGICLGLQVLFEGSEESPDVPGLGVLPGTVHRFQLPPEYKVPHIGWSRVGQQAMDCPLFTGIDDQTYFYFVHSYRADAALPTTAGVTEYGTSFTSAVWRGRMFAVQFHPEKSQQAGLQMLRNFAALVEE